MDLNTFSVVDLTRWVISGEDVEAILEEMSVQYGVTPDSLPRARQAVMSDLEHLQRVDLARLRGLRGDPAGLSQETAGILRW